MNRRNILCCAELGFFTAVTDRGEGKEDKPDAAREDEYRSRYTIDRTLRWHGRIGVRSTCISTALPAATGAHH
jgi:hypothetical protein